MSLEENYNEGTPLLNFELIVNLMPGDEIRYFVLRCFLNNEYDLAGETAVPASVKELCRGVMEGQFHPGDIYDLMHDLNPGACFTDNLFENNRSADCDIQEIQTVVPKTIQVWQHGQSVRKEIIEILLASNLLDELAKNVRRMTHIEEDVHKKVGAGLLFYLDCAMAKPINED